MNCKIDHNKNVQSCNENPCISESCQPKNWSEWSKCSKQCGLGGIQTRTRTISGQNCSEMGRQVQPCFVKLCSDEIYTLDYIEVKLSNVIHSGSDNSWKIRLWTDYDEKFEFCATDW